MADARTIALEIEALRLELRAAALEITVSNGKLQRLLSEKEWKEARAVIKTFKKVADDRAAEAWE